MIRDRGKKKEIKKKRNLEERTQRKYDRVYGSREVRRCRTRIRERRGGRKRRRNPSGGMECAFENPSTVFLPTLTYAPVRTRIGEKRSGAGGETRLALLVSQDYALSLSLSLSLFSTRSRSTTNRRRLVICFHTFAGICQSTPLSPPSASRVPFSFLSFLLFFPPLLFGFLHFLTFDSGRFTNPAASVRYRCVPIERETCIFPRVIFEEQKPTEGKTLEISSIDTFSSKN